MRRGTVRKPGRALTHAKNPWEGITAAPEALTPTIASNRAHGLVVDRAGWADHGAQSGLSLPNYNKERLATHLDGVLLHLVEERLVADLQFFGSLPLIPLGIPKRLLDHILLDD